MLADVDVTDIESDDGKITVFAPHTEYFKARQALLDAFGEVDFDVDEIQFIPQTTAQLNDEEQAVMDRLLDMLNDLEDVQNVYHSAA
jgi:transcriptional/translational regulatory protein YebC/TACO1